MPGFTVPATRNTRAFTLGVGYTNDLGAPSLSCSFFLHPDPASTDPSRDYFLLGLCLGGLGPNKAKTDVQRRFFKLWWHDRRASPVVEDPTFWSAELPLDVEDEDGDYPVAEVLIRNLAQPDNDDDDDYCTTHYSRMLRADPRLVPSVVCEAIEYTFSGRDDCWHEYDCCGCRTWYARDAKHHGNGWYTYNVTQTRNY